MVCSRYLAGISAFARLRPTGESGAVLARIYWPAHSQVVRRTLRTYRDNIAYNTLPYIFSRMLLLPHDVAASEGKALRKRLLTSGEASTPSVDRRFLLLQPLSRLAPIGCYPLPALSV